MENILFQTNKLAWNQNLLKESLLLKISNNQIKALPINNKYQNKNQIKTKTINK